MAAPSLKLKLPLPSHKAPHTCPPLLQSSDCGYLASCHRGYFSSPCRPLSTIPHSPLITPPSFLCQGRLSPALFFSFCPYHFLSGGGGHLFTQILAKKQSHVTTEKVSNGAMPRPDAWEVLEQGGERGVGLVAVPTAGALLVCRCGTERTKARHTHEGHSGPWPGP